jgi:hypothetical protein
LANSRLTTLKPFFLAKPLVNTTGSMPLSSVDDLLVFFKALFDEFQHFTGYHRRGTLSLFSFPG